MEKVIGEPATKECGKKGRQKEPFTFWEN